MRHYYTLITSLPVLPHPQKAQRLPINASRFAARLRMLEADDARVMQLAEDLLEWQRQPVDRSDAEFIAFYERLKNPPDVPSVWQEVPSSRPQGHYHAEDYTVLEPILTFRLNQRTLLAALRRKQLGLGVPADNEPWGIGRGWRTSADTGTPPILSSRAIFRGYPKPSGFRTGRQFRTGNATDEPRVAVFGKLCPARPV